MDDGRFAGLESFPHAAPDPWSDAGERAGAFTPAHGHGFGSFQADGVDDRRWTLELDPKEMFVAGVADADVQLVESDPPFLENGERHAEDQGAEAAPEDGAAGDERQCLRLRTGHIGGNEEDQDQGQWCQVEDLFGFGHLEDGPAEQLGDDQHDSGDGEEDG